MAIITGTDGSDSKTGTSSADRISGLGGNDNLRGLGGDDWLQGGLGNDGLDGGTGIDTASYLDATGSIVANLIFGTSSGNRGIDTFSSIENLEGGSSADTLIGAPGDNRLWGRGAGDFLYGQLGNDWLQGGPGDDIVDGGADFDTASYLDATGGITASLESGTSSGNRGNDTLVSIERLEGSNFANSLTGGFEAPVQLWGQGGNDTLLAQLFGFGSELDGGPGNDRLVGPAGFMAGGSGNDQLEGGTFELDGGPGDDHLLGADFEFNTLVGGPGSDWLDGGGGDETDTANYETEPSAIRADLAAGTVVTASGTDRLTSIESVEGSTQADTIRGDDGDNGLIGDGRFQVRGGNDLIEGRGGDDFLAGRFADDRLFGGRGNDQLTGGEGDDVLKGGDGDDRLEGGENQFPDILRSGDDELYGGAGDDFLRGGDDDDALAGGAGRDVFFFATSGFGDDSVEQFPPVKDVIIDFQRGADVISAPSSSPTTERVWRICGVRQQWQGRLDNDDQFVAVRNVTFEGATARSTVIDIGGFGRALSAIPMRPEPTR